MFVLTFAIIATIKTKKIRLILIKSYKSFDLHRCSSQRTWYS